MILNKGLSIKTTVTGASGFTLVELLVAMVMAIIFIGATLGIVNQSTRIYRAQERVSESQQDVRAALDLMMHDIRMAAYDPLKDTNGRVAGILVANATTFRFTRDLDASGAIEPNASEFLTFQFNAANNRLDMQRDATGPLEPIIENVTGMTFTYLDSDDNVLALPVNVTDIRRVMINVQGQSLGDKQGETFNRRLVTHINPRNLDF